MSVISQVQGSLETIGIAQQVCAFAFVVFYPLSLGQLFEARGRRIAALIAFAAVVGFAVTTRPWMHAVLLAAAAVASLGLFIVFAWVIDRLCGLAVRGLGARPIRAALQPPVAVAAVLPPQPERRRRQRVAVARGPAPGH